jgi:Holliday junction resolvase RusA-like endonuclease
MDPFVSVEVEGQPQGKGRPRFSTGRTKDGVPYTRVHTPLKTYTYETVIKRAAVKAMGERDPIEGCVKVDILCLFQIPKSWPKLDKQRALDGDIRPTGKPDWDNIAKVVCDAVRGIVWTDDSRVVDARVRKFYGKAPAVHFDVYADQ